MKVHVPAPLFSGMLVQIWVALSSLWERFRAISPFISHHVTTAQVEHYRNQRLKGCKGCFEPRAAASISSGL